MESLTPPGIRIFLPTWKNGKTRIVRFSYVPRRTRCNRCVFSARSTRCRCSPPVPVPVPVNGRLTSLTRRGSPGMARDAPTMYFPFRSWLTFLLLLLLSASFPEDRRTLIKMSQFATRRRTRTRSEFETPHHRVPPRAG